MENFDFNNVEKYLANGGDVETIMNAFADKVNLSLAAQTDNAYFEAIDNVVDAWNDYIDICAETNKIPENIDIEDLYIDQEDISSLTEMIFRLLPVLEKYFDFMDTVKHSTTEASKKVVDKTTSNFDSVVKSFFKKNGI